MAPQLQEQDGKSLSRLVEIMRRLLAPDGCPWDREQSLQTLRPYVIEEAHEVVDAIDGGKPEELREELGDLLLQIVFQSELARAQGWFGPDDVVSAICDKLVRRHPHVFGDAKVSGTREVLANWEAIKAEEKKDRGVLDGVPKALPALLRAMRVGEKAARVGFDWPDAAGARAKVNEELAELDAALAAGNKQEIEHELGDVLFALCSVGRKLDLDPEAALRGTLDRFTQRVRAAEGMAKADGLELSKLSPEALDTLWNRAKAAKTGP
ncbi:MAG TPA: nucleoside triphosphate pyrophosphohydrolase [Polyangiales bacterium]|jgi:tetrapyrrole methylase family protein/MazG family protein/ATP diphosphatase|nr:nucleoside triphosphate pyrophosphohydrolase [Polyangiales bacterium]